MGYIPGVSKELDMAEATLHPLTPPGWGSAESHWSPVRGALSCHAWACWLVLAEQPELSAPACNPWLKRLCPGACTWQRSKQR